MPSHHAVRNREFKIAAVDRMIAGENVSKLALELGVHRGLLYRWRDAYRSGGREAVRKPGRGRARAAKLKLKPGKPDPQARIKELERKIGQQQLELDFFRRALRQVEDLRRSAVSGEPRSTRSSK
jgi:transposase